MNNILKNMKKNKIIIKISYKSISQNISNEN